MTSDYSVSDTSVGAVYHTGPGGKIDTHRGWNVVYSPSTLKSDHPVDDGLVRGLHDSMAFATPLSTPQSLSRGQSTSDLKEDDDEDEAPQIVLSPLPQSSVDTPITPSTIKSTKAHNSHSSSMSPPPLPSMRHHKLGPLPTSNPSLPKLLTGPPPMTRSTSTTTTVLLSEDAANLWLAMDSVLCRTPDNMFPSELGPINPPKPPSERHASQFTAPIASSTLPLGPMERWERPEHSIREPKKGKKWRDSVGKRISFRRHSDGDSRSCVIA